MKNVLIVSGIIAGVVAVAAASYKLYTVVNSDDVHSTGPEAGSGSPGEDNKPDASE